MYAIRSYYDFVYIPNTNDYELTLVKLENETKYRGNNGYVVLSSLLHTVETVELINSIGQSVTYLTSGSQPGFSNVNDTITIKNIAPGKYFVKAKTNGNHILYTRFTINEYQLFEINKTQITDVNRITSYNVCYTKLLRFDTFKRKHSDESKRNRFGDCFK